MSIDYVLSAADETEGSEIPGQNGNGLIFNLARQRRSGQHEEHKRQDTQSRRRPARGHGYDKKEQQNKTPLIR